MSLDARLRRFLLRFPFLVLTISSAGSSWAGSGDIPVWQPPKTGLGLEVDMDRPGGEERPNPIRSPEVRSRGAQPLYVRVAFSWERVESPPGTFHWEEVEETVDRFREAGFEVILSPRGGHPLYSGRELPTPSQSDYLTAWKRFLRQSAERFRGKVRFYQIADNPDRPGVLADGAGAREAAFLFKTGSVEIRGADPDSLLVLGSVGTDHLDFLESLLKEDLGPYLDAVPLRGQAGVESAAVLERAAALLLRYVPAASLWLFQQPLPEASASSPGVGPPAEEAAPTPSAAQVPPVEPPASPGTAEGTAAGTGPPASQTQTAPAGASSTARAAAGAASDPARAGGLVRLYASCLAAGSRLTLFDLRPGASGEPELSALPVLLRRLFPPSLGPSPEGASKIRFLADPGGEAIPVEAWRFFDASTFQVVLVYAPLAPVSASARATVVLDTADVTGAAVDDLLAVTEKPAESIQPDRSANLTRAAVPMTTYPLILRYQRFATPGFIRKPESLEVGGRKEITAEEIIARHQEFQADQDSRLRSVMATGRIRYTYRVASADIAVDVTTVNTFYWDPKVGAEWEQRDFYFNGVRWTGKKLPDLPLIQPEKVVVLPLNINLNKNYRYRYLGLDTVDGRECYRIEFTPVTNDKSLYQGQVWIDRKTFARVRISSVQTGLEPPVISNDERDTYGPAPGAGERPLWVLERIDGQQIWNISGVNLVVLREVTFSDFSLNAPDFEARRKAAYESSHVMLRDTDKGFRYLDRTPAGDRVPRQENTKRTILGAAGVFYEKDLDYPIPLAGIDYFTFSFGGTKTQANLFFAGALLQGSIQDPRFLGTKLDAGVSALGVAFTSTDNFYLGDQRLDSEQVRQRSQSLSVNLGLPIGNFFKMKALGFLEYDQYGNGDETESFRIPVDTSVTGYGLQGEYDRRGFTVQARTERYRRSDWESWGDTDPASVAVGTRLVDFDPRERSYAHTRALVSKQFILPVFQRVVLTGEYLTGDQMDRFSKYEFGFFGDRVRGFSGSGVRFDRGVITSAGYSFNLAEILRFEGTVDYGHVRDSQVKRLDPTLGDYQDFLGFGISGNCMGPWSTLIRFDWGVAVKSDIPGLPGDMEIEFALLKFF